MNFFGICRDVLNSLHFTACQAYGPQTDTRIRTGEERRQNREAAFRMVCHTCC